MSDTLTPSERAAIEAYDGPVTVCPPRTFALDPTEAPSFRQRDNASWKNWHRGQRFKRAAQKTGEAKPAALHGSAARVVEQAERRRAEYQAVARADRTVADVAEALGVAPSTARKMLSQLGLPYRAINSSRHRSATSALEPEYRELAARMTAPEMARHLGKHIATVRSNLSRMGIQAKRHSNLGGNRRKRGAK